MSPWTVVVLHRDRLVAEALAAALDRFPGIAVVGCATSWNGSTPWGLMAAVVDTSLEDARKTVRDLRAAGVRVVALGPATRIGVVDAVIGADRPMTLLAAAVSPRPARRVAGLSPREREVMALAAKGLAGKQIARAMGISPKTVEQHKTRAFSKLGVPNQAAAIAVLSASEEVGWWTRSAI